MLINLAYYEKRYAISDEGWIKNLANNEKLKPVVNPNGYLKVGLANGDGTHNQRLLHILVAKHFIPNPYGYEQVNHKNGDKTDCSVGNLEWCTAKQNTEHAFKTGLRKGYMSADDKEVYLARVLKGEIISDIATEIGRCPNSLSKMLRETAKRINVLDQWQDEMKRRRRDAAIRNLEKVNS